MKTFFINFIPITFHPLWWITVMLILGIICQATKISLYLSFLFVLINISILCYTYFKYTYTLKNIVIYSTAISCFFLIQIRMIFLEKNFLYQQILLSNNNISCKGIICSIEQSSNRRFRAVITLSLNYIKDNSAWKKCNSCIKCYVTHLPNLAVSDYVKLKNITCSISKNSYFNYAIKNNIAAMVFVQKLNYKVLHRPKHSLIRYISNIQTNIITNLTKKMSKKTSTLFCSIFLGTKTIHQEYFEALKDQFTKWGIVHYLARSGLHVVIIVWAWSSILALIPCSFIIRRWILSFFVFIYHILTWSSISFIRALLTFLCYQACIFKGLPIHTLHILFLVSFIILLYNPYQLFFLDFQLSFSLTLALAWFNEIQMHLKQDI